MLEYLPVNKNLLPHVFRMRLNNVTFKFEFNYNDEYDFFTTDLYRGDKLLIAGEKIVYGHPLFEPHANHYYPERILFPFDISGNVNIVNWETFMEDVFIYIIEEEENV